MFVKANAFFNYEMAFTTSAQKEKQNAGREMTHLTYNAAQPI